MLHAASLGQLFHGFSGVLLLGCSCGKMGMEQDEGSIREMHGGGSNRAGNCKGTGRGEKVRAQEQKSERKWGAVKGEVGMKKEVLFPRENERGNEAGSGKSEEKRRKWPQRWA